MDILKKFKSGKYEGQTYVSVWKQDRSYINFLANKYDNFLELKNYLESIDVDIFDDEDIFGDDDKTFNNQAAKKKINVYDKFSTGIYSGQS